MSYRNILLAKATLFVRAVAIFFTVLAVGTALGAFCFCLFGFTLATTIGKSNA
jgi:hypothetical protein